MTELNKESFIKLQRILRNRIKRELSQEEIKLAYDNLMSFGEALLSLDVSDVETGLKENEPLKTPASEPYSQSVNLGVRK